MANSGVKFMRVDAEIADELKDDGECAEIPEIKDIFARVAGEGTEILFERFKDTSTPALLHVSEDNRRIEDMMKLYAMRGMDGMSFPMDSKATLTVNVASPLIGSLAEKCSSRPELAEKIAKQIYTLCVLSQRGLSSEELPALLDGSFELLGML